MMVLRLKSAKASLKRLIADERGVSAIEYGLLASLVALASVQAMGGLGDVLDTSFGAAASDFSDGGTADDVVTGMTAGEPGAGDGSAVTGADESSSSNNEVVEEPSVVSADEPSVAAAGMAYEDPATFEEPPIAAMAPPVDGDYAVANGNGKGAEEPSIPMFKPADGE